MKNFLVNARAIEIKVTTDKGIALLLGGRYCNMTTFTHTLPTVKMTDVELVEHIRNHYHGFAFGILNNTDDLPSVSPSRHLDKLNSIFNERLIELILSVDKYDDVDNFHHIFETEHGEVYVEAIIRGHISVERRDLEDELKNSYLDYAMSVIVGRALPDVRDGLKPVHRRSLFAMDVLGNGAGKPYKKSARVVGDVIGKYHPHGDTAVYDTIVRLAQPFSMRYPLVDGQGNFGSVDGDSAAAMRYTEIRMNKITEMLMKDMDCETVDYVPNYDGTEMIPSVFPTRIPTLLVNGSSGIAVGMATNIPPHNLSEVIAGCHAYIEDKEITNEELMEHITGPDFPTGAIINGKQGIVDAYTTGRGKIYMRAVAHIESSKTNRESIVVTEIPYQVNKAKLIEKMAELVKDRKLEGISHLRDESDKDGMRIVIDIKRDAIAEVVLNNLYTLTQMQHTFGINMVALQDGQPKIFDLKGLIKAFVNHRCEVVTRRTIFNLRKAKERMNILEGYVLCRSHLDEIIKIIKDSPNKRVAMDTILEKPWTVREELVMLLRRTHANLDVDGDVVSFNEEQVQAILDLRLYQLTNMEKSKVLNELADFVTSVNEYEELLGDSEVLMEKISEELDDIYTEFGDERKTSIIASFQELQSEDLIEDEHVVLTLSDAGYVKYQPVSEYNEQRRGGVGKASSNMKQEDFMTTLIVCKTHDTVLCFSSTGRMYWSKVYQLPAASRGSRGKPIVNILPVGENEVITAILPVRSYDDNHFVFMATRMGVVKKVAMSAFSRPRQSGIIAINLADNDELVGCGVTDGTKDIMLFSDNGKVVRFPEEQVRAMGRTATGVRGMRLKETGNVVSLVIPKDGDTILTATARGYGKNTELSEYPVKGRGTQGVVSIKVTSRNGLVIGAVAARYEESILLIANTGMMIRTPVAQMPTIGRNTQGVIIMRVKDKDDETRLVGLSRVVEIDDAEMVGICEVEESEE